MKTLVVYDSEFGNTEKVAKRVAEVLKADVLVSSEVKQENLNDLDVLIVGSPTQAFQPLKPVKVFLNGLGSDSLKGIKVGAFDTRMDIELVNNRLLTTLTKLFGYANKSIARQLVRKGGVQTIEPVGFIVTDKEGPLREGELERAAAWAKGMLS